MYIGLVVQHVLASFELHSGLDLSTLYLEIMNEK